MRRQDDGTKPVEDGARHATADRKAEHIRIVLEENVEGRGITNGFERYRFKRAALPERD